MDKLLKIRQMLGLPEVSQRRIRSFLHSVGRTVPDVRVQPETLALVVPCYNHATFLPTTFQSVLQQTRKPDEVILVNDFSSDDTCDALRKLAQDGRAAGIDVKIVDNPHNIGQCASINKAVEMAGTDLMMILNDDDYLFHDAVEMAIELFEENDDIHLLGASSVHFDSDAALAAHDKLIRNVATPETLVLRRSLPKDVSGYRNFNDLNMTHSGTCFTKAAWEHVGGYNPEKRKRVVPFSDRDFQLRVNAFFPVAVSLEVPFSFWRNNSSVDKGIDS